MIKKELLESVIEVYNKEENYLQLNEEVKNAKELKDGIALVNKYENLLKGVNKRSINTVRKQGQILKTFKEEDDFVNCVDLSRSNIYFKIRLHKFLWKFPVLKKSILAPSYCKTNFKLIKKVFKSNADVFGDIK